MISERLNLKEKISLKEKIRYFFALLLKNKFFNNIFKKILRQGITSEFLRNPLAQWLLIMSLFVSVANWVTLAFFIRPVDFPIVLHYNVYFGVDIIGSWWQVYFLPLTGAVIFLTNAVLAHFFYRNKERIVSYVLLFAALAVQVGITIAEVGIILINY